MLLRTVSLIALFLLPLSCQLLLPADLEPLQEWRVPIPEPSGVCVAEDGRSVWIAGDEGHLLHMDLKGRTLQKERFKGRDWEDIAWYKDRLLLLDEKKCEWWEVSPQKLKKEGERELPCPGSSRNGLEAITPGPEGEIWVANEKNPRRLYRLTPKGKELGRQELRGLPDISAIAWREGRLWLLSDEAASLALWDTENEKVERYWRLPVYNPEGLAFLPDGRLLVLSDAEGKMYLFGVKE